MRKIDEINEIGSCFNRAQGTELIFVLLGRDPAAPVAIRAWINERVRLLRNQPEDSQITEALKLAEQMEKEARL